MEIIIGELLTQKGWRLAVAESCTGGLISNLITNIAGSSNYYLGGVTAYANESKMHLLGVKRETLEKFGAVSEETVIEMAHGVRTVLAADIGISVSGIAGPGGGTLDKPVGLTWIGLSDRTTEKALRDIWKGDRLAVKTQAAQAAMQLLADHLSGLGD